MPLLRRLLLAAGIGLAALELVLQVAAVVAALASGGGPPAGGAGGLAPILCVGDSYTYGLGASAAEQAYPAALQRLLRARDAAAPEVRNAGWPGQNSREALLRLDGQLDRYRPRLVCVLIGLNDSWTRPAPLAADELGGDHGPGFTLRFRTWRLLRLLFGREQAALPTAAPGRTPDRPGEPALPAADDPDPARAAVALVQAGQHDAAIARLERAIDEDPDRAAEYHQGLVQLRTSLGRREEAARSLQWLRERHEQQPSQAVAEAYATALSAAGDRALAAAVAVAGAERFPRSSTLWWIASQHHYDQGDLARAERDLEQALAAADPANADWRAALHRDLAKACCDRDADEAIRNLLQALRLDRDVERCRIIVEGAASAFPQAAVTRALARLPRDDDDRELLHRLFGAGFGDRSAMCDVLRGHLRAIVRRCLDRGCRVVLLGYPLAVADLEAAQREVARELGVPFVPCLPAFTRELGRRPREELYIRDGHCTDAGYALMAATALPAVLAALQE